jgi:secreted Zn-dependent insulinase-like peptidase
LDNSYLAGLYPEEYCVQRGRCSEGARQNYRKNSTRAFNDRNLEADEKHSSDGRKFLDRGELFWILNNHSLTHPPNSSHQTVNKLREYIDTSLGLTGKGDDSHNVNITLPLTKNQDYVHIRGLKNPKELNHAVEYYIQVRSGELTNIQARILLLAHLMYPQAFKVLRTDERLGYLAFTTSWVQATAVGLVIRVQGEKAPSEVVSRIDEFLKQYRGILDDMSSDDDDDDDKGEFEERRDALVEKLRQSPLNLDAKAIRMAHPYLTGSDPDQRKGFIFSTHEF